MRFKQLITVCSGRACFALFLCFALAPFRESTAAAALLPPGVTDSISINNASDDAQKDYPVQFGRAFMPGEIPHYPQVLVDGTPVLTQADVKNRYPDGSVKFCVISLLLPSMPSQGKTALTFRDQPTGNNSPLSQSQMLDAAFEFDARITLSQHGKTQSASARKMLQASNFTYWTQGSVATTIILADHSRARKYDMGFDSLRSIRPIFEATFWPGINKVDVRVAAENVSTETLEDVQADLGISIGVDSRPVYAKSGLVMFAATRWNKEFWIGGAPQQDINVDYNIAYLAATKFIPNFDPSLKFSEFEIAGNYARWLAAPHDLYDQGQWTKSMSNSGGRCDIGPYPCWMMQWLYTGDWRLREVALGQADLADAWPLQVREDDEAKKFDRAQKIPAIGRPISIFAHPTEWLFDSREARNKIVIHGERIMLAFNQGGHPLVNLDWTPDGAHQPDPFSIPYLLTGKHWYLEEMQYWAATQALAYPACGHDTWCVRSASPVVAGIWDEVRGKAWVLRNRAHAALLSPDGTPEQTFFNDILRDAIAVWEGQRGITETSLKESPAWKWGQSLRIVVSPLHFFEPIGRGWPPDGPDLFVHGKVDTEKLWMDHFLMIELAHVKELGYPTGPLLKWFAPVLTAQFSAPPPFDPHLVAAYDTPLDAGHGTPPFKTWLEVYAEYSPGTFNMPDFKDNFRDFGKIGYTHILAATAGAMVANEPGGLVAWKWLRANVRENPDARADFWYHSEPQWNILPRQSE